MSKHSPTRKLPARAARDRANDAISAQQACEDEPPLNTRASARDGQYDRIPRECRPFEISDKNVYPLGKRNVMPERVHPLPYACKENAEAQIECMKCFPGCENKRLQKPVDWPEGKVMKTEGRGYGYFAPRTGLAPGTAVGQYTGEVVPKVDIANSEEQVYSMHLNECLCLDATNVGGFTRFMNHSCEPNCVMQKWQVCGLPCVGIFTLRCIEPEEELTFDYGVDFADKKAFVCNCAKCSREQLMRGALER